MAKITDTEAIRFCNEQIRPLAEDAVADVWGGRY